MHLLYRGLLASALSTLALGVSAQNLVANGSFETPASGGQACFANSVVGS